MSDCGFRMWERLNAAWSRHPKSAIRHPKSPSHRPRTGFRQGVSGIPAGSSGFSSLNERVNQIRPAVARRFDRSRHCSLDLLTVLNLLALDVVSVRNIDEIDIGITKVRKHVFLCFSLTSAGRIHPAPRFVVRPIVEYDDDDRDVIARHRPEGFALSEQKSAVTLQAYDLIVRARELGTDRSANAPSQRISGGSSDLRFLARGKREP